MKKIYLITVACMALTLNGMAQCVPASTFTGWGVDFSPTNADPVFACLGCGDEEVVISLRTLTDTALVIALDPQNPDNLLPLTASVDRLRLDSIAGLPAGLTYTTDAAFDTTYDEITNPFGYWPNGGDTIVGLTPTTGCISITGTAADWTAAIGGGPNNDGLYPLVIYLDARVAKFDPGFITQFVALGSWLSELGPLLPAFGDTNFTVNGIRYEEVVLDVRQSGVGVNEIASQGSTILENHPNPFSGVTTIRFNSEAGKDVLLSVYGILGNAVYSRKQKTVTGSNEFRFDATGLPSGIYLYSISDGDKTVTQKMSIK